MSENRYKCPSCEAILKTANALPVGKMVKCPKCATPFKVSGPLAAARPVAATPAAVTKKPLKGKPAPPLEDEDEDDKPAPAKARKGAKLPPPPVDDEDEPDEDDKPVKSKKGKSKPSGAKKSKLPLILGALAGVVLLGGGVVGGLYALGLFTDEKQPLKTYPAPAKEVGDQPLAQVIVGRWQPTGSTSVYEYRDNNVFIMWHANGSAVTGTYQVLNDTEIETVVTLADQPVTMKEKFVVKGDELTCTDAANKATTFKRLKDGGSPTEKEGDQPLAKVLVGQWTVGGSIYEFKADGTWTTAHSNGSGESGTYKVLNNKDIERRLNDSPEFVMKETCVVRGDELTWSDQTGYLSKLNRVRTTGGPPKTEDKADVVLTPDQISHEFGNDSFDALRTYAGKVLEVTGVFVQCDYGDLSTEVRLAGAKPDFPGYVSFKFSLANPEVLPHALPGQTVTLRGRVDPNLGLFKKWAIVKVTGDAPPTYPAEQLAKDFATNPDAVMAKIKDKHAIVMGTVTAVGTEPNAGLTVLTLTAPGQIPALTCTMRSDSIKGKPKKTYKVGDKVKILGLVDSAGLVLRRCEEMPDAPGGVRK